MKWLFLRHGEIQSNRKKVYAGWSEEEVTPRGRQQAIEGAKKLLASDIGTIYCSPLKRTVQTAQIIGEILRKKPIPFESFKELKLGIWEGKREEEIQRDFPEEWDLWNTRPAELVVEGRETLHELLERVLSGVNKIKAQHRDGNVLVVTHVAIIRVLVLYTHDLDLNSYRTVAIPNGEVIEIKGL